MFSSTPLAWLSSAAMCERYTSSGLVSGYELGNLPMPSMGSFWSCAATASTSAEDEAMTLGYAELEAQRRRQRVGANAQTAATDVRGVVGGSREERQADRTVFIAWG
jgi:hypothetical protein